MTKRILTAAMAACLALGAMADTATAETLKLGYLTARTGPYVSLAETNYLAAELAVEEINAAGGVGGNMIELVPFDTAGKPEQAVLGLRSLTRDNGVLAVIGPFSTNECQVVFPLGEREGIVTMSMGSSAPGLTGPFSYGFRNTTNEVILVKKAIAGLKSRGEVKTAAIAHATDDAISLAVGTKILPMVFDGAGIGVEKMVDFRLAAFDLAPQVSQLVQQPTDIVALGGFPEQAVRLVQEMRRQGHKGRLVSGSMIYDVTLPARMGADGEGTISSTAFWWDANDTSRAFSATFHDRAVAESYARVEPSQFDAATYSIVRIYAQAMAQAGVTGDPAKLAEERTAIRDALAGGIAVETVEGEIRFDEAGDAIKQTLALEVRDGAWHPIALD